MSDNPLALPSYFPDPSDQFIADIRDKGERSGPLAVSPKGATGTMQVMPGTAADPGFGIRPSDGSAADTERVGQEYARMLLARYSGNQILASAAYNAGPSKVDQWIQQFGDPRLGQISNADWQAKIPFNETKAYTQRVAGGGSEAATSNPLNIPAPSQEPADNALAVPTAQPLPSALQALRLIATLVPANHKLISVDYNPYQKGLPGAGS